MRTPLRAFSLVTALALVAACSGKKKPDRREKPEPTAAGTATVTAGPAATPSQVGGPSPAPGGRPNVLIVLADDQRADSVACMPRLQKIFEGGTKFTHYFAATPLCCPGRTTLLTGRYTHNHGVLQNGDVEDGDPQNRAPGAQDFANNGNEQRIVARWLQKAGYRTAMLGKYLNGYDFVLKKGKHVPPYWDDWYVFPHAEYFDFELVERKKGEAEAKRVCYVSGTKKGKNTEQECKKHADSVVDDGAENYSTDILAKHAIEVIRSASKEKVPFFIYFAPKAPHGPFQSPARYQPDPKKSVFTQEAMDRLGTCSLFDWKERPPSYLEKDVSDKPTWIRDAAGSEKEGKLDDVRRGQLASVLATEDAMAEILATLDRTGQRENTILLYLGDNGYSWGEHGYRGKNCAYDVCSRVPFFYLDPRRKVAPGATNDALVADIDIAPTIAGLAGATVPADQKMDGAPLQGLFEAPARPWRDHMLTECWGLGRKAHPDTHASVRSKKWKYVEHYEDEARTRLVKSGGRDEVELYDLEKDPDEMDNLLFLPEAKLSATGHSKAEIDKVAADLKVRLEKLKAEK